MAKKIIVKDIVVGDPICHPWYMFCNEYNEWDLIKDDVTLQDGRRYGDLLDRKDWIYDRQNHSIQDWKYGDENLRIKMVDGECIYIEKLDE